MFLNKFGEVRFAMKLSGDIVMAGRSKKIFESFFLALRTRLILNETTSAAFADVSGLVAAIQKKLLVLGFISCFTA